MAIQNKSIQDNIIIEAFCLLSDKGETIILIVEITSEKRPKPFLGGFRVMPDDIEYHHAGMQTEKVRKRSWSKQFEGK